MFQRFSGSPRHTGHRGSRHISRDTRLLGEKLVDPPELAADIIDRGMALVGGGAMLRRIDEFLTQHTGVPAYAADDPMACVATGAGKALEHIHLFQRTLTTLWSSL